MGKFCSNCGSEIKEGADVCLKCGAFLNNTSSNKKVPGKGKAIAGMVLGIIAVTWALLALIGVENLSESLVMYSLLAEFIGFAIGYTLFSLPTSIVGLCLSIASIKTKKSGKAIAGLVLNTIALAISIILFLIIIAHYN